MHKYSISAMCRCLKIARSTCYYEVKGLPDEAELEEEILTIFNQNRKVYGTRKLKEKLEKLGKTVSRRKIGRIMKKLAIVSKYTIAQYKVHKTTCNEEPVKNELKREFDNQPKLGVVISDLTYIRVGQKWNYACVLLDLFNREIIGFSTGEHKNAALVYRAFSTVKAPLSNIGMFHTDRGSEFKNTVIDDALNTFGISRSLSNKGCPYDNAVAEATFKIIKTEFVYGEKFDSLEQLQASLADYVHWFNNIRIHSSLNYLSPVEFKNMAL